MADNDKLRPPTNGHSPTPLDSAYRLFMLSREAMRCTPKTLEHYEYTAGGFVSWLKGRGVAYSEQITANHIRNYLAIFARKRVKDTTLHAQYRGIKTFVRWLAREEIGQESTLRVEAPRLEQRVPEPFTADDIRKLLAACNTKTARGARDHAIVLTLLDTGLRLEEFIALKVGDVDMRTGLTTVLGKGRKQRTVRVGAKARAAIIKMLVLRGGAERGEPLWLAYEPLKGTPRGALTKNGLQTILVRLGQAAGVRGCSAHRFRRTFALWALRSGMDLHSLRLLMGHANLDVLQRYLALGGQDIERAHKEFSPVDKFLEQERR